MLLNFLFSYYMVWYEHKRGCVTGDGRKLCNEELHELYCWPNIMSKSDKMMRWAGHAAQAKKNTYRALVGKPEIKNLLEDLGIAGWII